MIELSYITDEAFVADVIAIADALDSEDWTPDYIVGIGRGGLVPATYLSHRTGVSLLSIDYSSDVPSFGDALIERLAQLTRDGRTLLLIDDINDSGGTINAVRGALASAVAKAEQVRVAVLIDNIRSAARADYSSRTIDRNADKRWFVFPWEAMANASKLLVEAQEVPSRLA